MDEIFLGWFTKPTILWSIKDYIILFIEIIILAYIIYGIDIIIEKMKNRNHKKK